MSNPTANNSKFSVQARIKSFSYAIKGIKLIFASQHNAWIHGLATIVVVILGFALKVNNSEWCLLALAIGLVLTAEAINTSIEYLTDLVSPNYHQTAEKVKDIAAGAVLLASITSFSIGLIIFLPKLFLAS